MDKPDRVREYSALRVKHWPYPPPMFEPRRSWWRSPMFFLAGIGVWHIIHVLLEILR